MPTPSGSSETPILDLVIIGAGPCGLAAGIAAQEAGLSYQILDKGCITSSIVGYPYYMSFFSTAVRLEIGGLPFAIPEANPTRRQALTYYRRVVDHYSLKVRQYEEVLSIQGEVGAFRLSTRGADGTERGLHAKTVVIAIGGFHGPNRLNVPGEELDKVLHYYREPYPFFDQDVLVIGGANSAVESALEMYRNGVRVRMVHFNEIFDRGVKPWVRPDIDNRIKNGDIPMSWGHRVSRITPNSVWLRDEATGAEKEFPNDWVIAMTGWRANPMLMTQVGAERDEETGVPLHNPETMETNVPGVYIAGVMAAGHNANKIFIENGREHGALLAAHIAKTYR